MTTRVKICGLTGSEAVKLAADAGAHAVGFVHYPPSSRHLDFPAIEHLVRQTPPFLQTVGLLVNPDAAIIQKLKATGVDLLQIHGQGADHCEALGYPYIQAIPVRTIEDVDHALERFPNARALLLDAFHATGAGGTGLTFNWRLIPKKHASRLIIAGGLTRDNVGSLIREYHPCAVDVSSGVESQPGVKSADKIRTFMHAVATAHAG